MTDREMPLPSPELPEQPIMRIVEPIVRFLRIEAVGGIVLLGAAVAALGLANSPLADRFLSMWTVPIGIQFGSFALVYSLHEVVNDGLMTLFFFLAGLEIKRELVLGELRTLRLAALPIAAAAGGMAVPALIYLALQIGGPGEAGWGTVMATDIAFVVGCLALLGSRVPRSLYVFVLSLAIMDDLGAILVIAIGYTSQLHVVPLAFAIAGLGVVVAMRRLGVRSVPAFYAIGIPIWFAVHESGVHATVTGVALGLMTPVHAWVGADRFHSIASAMRRRIAGGHHDSGGERRLLRSVAFAARETLSPLERLEDALHPWVSYLVMPLFAFANAGVPLSAAEVGDSVVLAIVAGLVMGKPVGILAASWLAVRLGIAVRPQELGWPVIGAAGALAGIGFTMALFIADLAFSEALLDAAKFGVLAASAISAVFGLALLAAVLRRRAMG